MMFTSYHEGRSFSPSSPLRFILIKVLLKHSICIYELSYHSGGEPARLPLRVKLLSRGGDKKSFECESVGAETLRQSHGLASISEHFVEVSALRQLKLTIERDSVIQLIIELLMASDYVKSSPPE
jgi:hypothetical protein